MLFWAEMLFYCKVEMNDGSEVRGQKVKLHQTLHCQIKELVKRATIASRKLPM